MQIFANAKWGLKIGLFNFNGGHFRNNVGLLVKISMPLEKYKYKPNSHLFIKYLPTCSIVYLDEIIKN